MQVFEEIWLGLTPGLNIYEAKHLEKIFKQFKSEIFNKIHELESVLQLFDELLCATSDYSILKHFFCQVRSNKLGQIQCFVRFYPVTMPIALPSR